MYSCISCHFHNIRLQCILHALALGWTFDLSCDRLDSEDPDDEPNQPAKFGPNPIKTELSQRKTNKQKPVITNMERSEKKSVDQSDAQRALDGCPVSPPPPPPLVPPSFPRCVNGINCPEHTLMSAMFFLHTSFFSFAFIAGKLFQKFTVPTA